MTKFHNNWARIVNFLSMINFGLSRKFLSRVSRYSTINSSLGSGIFCKDIYFQCKLKHTLPKLRHHIWKLWCHGVEVWAAGRPAGMTPCSPLCYCCRWIRRNRFPPRCKDPRHSNRIQMVGYPSARPASTITDRGLTERGND